MLKSEKIATIVISSNNDTLLPVFAAKGLGPIVSAKTVSEAKAKYAEAFELGCATRNFIFYSETIKSPDKQKEKTIDSIKKNKHKNKNSKTEKHNFAYILKQIA